MGYKLQTPLCMRKATLARWGLQSNVHAGKLGKVFGNWRGKWFWQDDNCFCVATMEGGLQIQVKKGACRVRDSGLPLQADSPLVGD
jgi:hypothetical protein